MKMLNYIQFISESRSLSIQGEKRENAIADSTGGFNSPEEGEEHLEYLINTNYPYGFKNIPDEVWLFRILFIPEGEEINKGSFGTSWTWNPDNVTDEEWVDLIRTTTDSPNVEPHIVAAKFKASGIDEEWTIRTNLMYPSEEEIFIKESVAPIKYEIYKPGEFNRQEWWSRIYSSNEELT